MNLKKVRYKFKATKDGHGQPGDIQFMFLDISEIKSMGRESRLNSYQVEKIIDEIMEEE